MSQMIEMTLEEARRALEAGKAPSHLRVRGTSHIMLRITPAMLHLPQVLEVDGMLAIEGYGTQTIPREVLPREIRCRFLSLRNVEISEFPADFHVESTLELHNCTQLTSLPADLCLWRLSIDRCERLSKVVLPRRVQHVSICGCPSLQTISGDMDGASDTSWGSSCTIADCPNLTTLPRRIKTDFFSLEQCPAIRDLPDLLVSQKCAIKNCLRLVALPERIQMEALELAYLSPTTRLPQQIEVQDLTINYCPLAHLPTHVTVARNLNLEGCPQISELWPGLRLMSLKINECSGLTRLPDDLEVSHKFEARECTGLQALPIGLRKLLLVDVTGCALLSTLPPELDVYRLIARNCRNLRALPEKLHAVIVDISGCSQLAAWPSAGIAGLWRLYMGGCSQLASLPPGNITLNQLDIADCPRLTELPTALRVTDWLDIAGTPLRYLPPTAKGFRLRWHGVMVSAQVALHPQTITARQVLREQNVEVRRVMIERMGPQRFIREAHPDLLDLDEDAGGQRALLRINLGREEPLVYLQVQDPSTGRQYLLRVPPTMTTCRQAAAWVAGFDDPDAYHPVQET